MLRVATLMHANCPWQDADLIKDKGLIPYLMYKEHGCEAVLVGLQPFVNDDGKTLETGLYGPDDEKLLEQYYPSYHYIHGLYMRFVEQFDTKQRIDYITKHAAEIDILILIGSYNWNWARPELYHRLNPDGKVYCGLDMNSGWLSRFDFSDPSLRSFMDHCDVIATSCTSLADRMSYELPWKVHCISNGSYEFDGVHLPWQEWEKRENKIITVGRLGTDQKRTDVLLLAFAIIADFYPEWKLELIGSVEDAFRPVLDYFFQKFPDIKDRIIFSGYIRDRNLLREKYRSAKIFALTSDMEGGAPNVASDALNNGCVMCVTQVDAYRDMIHDGKCGLSSKCGDIQEFANNLARLCGSQDLEKMSEESYKWGREFYDMEKNVNRLMNMLYPESGDSNIDE